MLDPGDVGEALAEEAVWCVDFLIARVSARPVTQKNKWRPLVARCLFRAIRRVKQSEMFRTSPFWSVFYNLRTMLTQAGAFIPATTFRRGVQTGKFNRKIEDRTMRLEQRMTAWEIEKRRRESERWDW